MGIYVYVVVVVSCLLVCLFVSLCVECEFGCKLMLMDLFQEVCGKTTKGSFCIVFSPKKKKSDVGHGIC